MIQDLLEEISDLKRTVGAVKAREADAKAALSMEATMVNKRVKDLQLQLDDASERQRELQRVRRALKTRTAELIDHERMTESKMALQQKVQLAGMTWANKIASPLFRVLRQIFAADGSFQVEESLRSEMQTTEVQTAREHARLMVREFREFERRSDCIARCLRAACYLDQSVISQRL